MLVYKMSSSDSIETPQLGNSPARHIGRVKWFNNKHGYGFITLNDDGSDIFVHHTGILVSSEQYKYLVQGEYVEFTLDKTEGGSHEYQAGKVSGINGGKLMCETRRDFKQTREIERPPSRREDVSQEDGDSEPVKMPRSVRAPREPVVATSEISSESVGGSPWTLVGKQRAPATGRGGAGRGRGGTGRGRGRPPRAPVSADA